MKLAKATPIARSRLLRLRRGLAIAAHQRPLLGYWDGDSHTIRWSRTVRLHGWAASLSGVSPKVIVTCDGEPLVAVSPALTRVDVADHLRVDRGATLGWEASITLTDGDLGSLVSVVCTDGERRVDLGTRRVVEAERVTAAHLDSPVTGACVRAGGVLRVSGWALFDGLPADSVLAYLGDELPVPIRTATPRKGLGEMLDADEAHPAAIAAGFDGLIPVDRSWAGRTTRLLVEVIGTRGERVALGPTTVRIEAPANFARAVVTPLADRLRTVRPTQGADEPHERHRVCAFTHQLEFGGGELYLQELLVRLSAGDEFDLLVVSPSDGPLRKELENAGIPVHITRPYAYDAGRYEGCVAELAALVSAWQADTVVVNTLGVFPAVEAALTAELPIIWAVHESFDLATFEYLNWGERGLHPDVRDRWLHCLEEATVVFETQTTFELIRAEAPGVRARVVPYGINTKRIEAYRTTRNRAQLRSAFGFHPTDLVFLCMGVVQERKAQLALVLAFAEIAAAHPGTSLVIVGDRDHPYARAVRDLVGRLRLGARVRIEPVQADIYQWYLAADVLVSASDAESVPRSIIEAMAFGRPTLATRVYGVTDLVVDGQTGWLCEPYSRTALVAGLRRVIASPAQDRDRMSARCLEASARFDGRNYARAYSQLIDELQTATTDSARVGSRS